MTTRNLVPRADGEGSLGTAAKQWGAMRAKNIYIDGVDVTEAVTSTADNAEAAASSATSASNSASSASTTATQLMAYLEDKETLTAPAVDPTFSISGAAADAKVTGDNLYGDTVVKPFSLGTIVANERTNPYDGRFDPTGGWKRTDYIPVDNAITVYGSNGNCSIVTYTASKTFVHSVNLPTEGYTFSAVEKYCSITGGNANMDSLQVVAQYPTRFSTDEQTINRQGTKIDTNSYLPLKPLVCETKARCLWQRAYTPSAWSGAYEEDGWTGNAWYKVSGISGNSFVTVESGGVASISDIAGDTKKIPMVISPDGVHYKTCLAWYMDATTIGVYPALDTTFSDGVIGALWVDGMHLTKRGYIAFSQAMFAQNPKHCEKGSYIAKYDPDFDDTVPFTKIGSLYANLGSGNPWNDNWNFWVATRQRTYYMQNSASFEQTEKKGIYWSVPTNGKKGYVEVLIGGRSATDFTIPTGYEIHIDVYQDGVLKESYVKTTNIVEDVCIDFDYAANILIEIYQNKYTAFGNVNGNGFTISSVFVWENQLTHGTELIPKGSVIGQMFDSWGVHQNEATAKEFSRLINEATGVTVPYTNHSLGSQTSAWGKAWFYENVQKYNPSVALIDFCINDQNSGSASVPDTVAGPDGTLYDNKISIDEYVTNMNTLSNEARSNNIQLIITPPDLWISGQWYTKLCAEIE